MLFRIFCKNRKCILLVSIFILTLISCFYCENNIDLKNSKVYGPGLIANFTVPVRYFFIQLVTERNNSFSILPQSLSIQVSGLEQKCRIWYQLLQVKEGLFIARYRLYETCQSVKIDIVYENQLVADSPYIVEGMLYHEQCYCPQPMTEWLSSLNCPSSYSQIKYDLSSFPSINMKDVVTDAFSRFNHPGSFSICHYSVISNQTYLPNFELIVNLGDWPLEQRAENPIPIFSWCGSKYTKDIVMPTYDITEATLEMMGRVMVDILSVMGNSGPTWEEKLKVAFWRGRDSRQERLDLIKLSRQYPDLINASLTNFFFFRQEEAEYGPKTEYIPFFDFFKYRYQINIDGTVAAYRFPYLLAGRSLALKQDSEFYEHFYNDLVPMFHYIPFQRNLSDLVLKINWALSHDSEAKAIAENAQEFVLNNLMPKDILCYYTVLFNEYSKKLNVKSEVHEGMEKVTQPPQKDCICSNNDPVKQAKSEL
nr:protein O-glucosyltransferase 2 isoform X2 [Parasteatoda tepidariorum]